MSIGLKLGVGILAGDTVINNADIDSIVSNIPGIFYSGSGSDIELEAYKSGINFGDVYSGVVGDQQLHRALKKITGRQRGGRKIKNIGLLIADRFEPREDYFGVMFDRAFEPNDFDPYTNTPREGCAVFLGSICNRRNTYADKLRELLFTSVHELGHVFNLQHVKTPSYLATSAGRSEPFDDDEFRFTDRHEYLLSNCSTSPYIWPGGSRFEDQGPLGEANAARKDFPASSGIALKIDMAQREFWPFEPVELDVEIQLVDESKKYVRVPDMVDPGFSEFRIWIEEPDGSRRKYRSPRHYCSHNKKFVVRRDESFQRDISIFGQSGGYAFCQIGVHKIFVEFFTPKLLRSNTIEVNILPDVPDNTFYQHAKQCFTDSHIGKLLYHRQFIYKSRYGSRRVKQFCLQYPNQPSTGMVNYALGRAIAELVSKQVKTDRRARDQKAAVGLLQSAIKHRGLTDHRRKIAEKAILTVMV